MLEGIFFVMNADIKVMLLYFNMFSCLAAEECT